VEIVSPETNVSPKMTRASPAATVIESVFGVVLVLYTVLVAETKPDGVKAVALTVAEEVVAALTEPTPPVDSQWA
jgi:hypothetical protein